MHIKSNFALMAAAVVVLPGLSSQAGAQVALTSATAELSGTFSVSLAIGDDLADDASGSIPFPFSAEEIPEAVNEITATDTYPEFPRYNAFVTPSARAKWSRSAPDRFTAQYNLEVFAGAQGVGDVNMSGSSAVTMAFDVVGGPVELVSHFGAGSPEYGQIHEGVAVENAVLFSLTGTGITDIEMSESASGVMGENLFTEQVRLNGLVLQPGSYVMTLTLSGSILGSTEGSAERPATVATRFKSLSNISIQASEDAEVFFWEGLDGSFDDETNWEPEGVPGSGDTAIFDKDQSYIVTFGPEESSHAIVERGDLSFLGGSYSVSGGGTADPSLAVGNEAADSAFLSLLANHALQTNFVAIGKGPATNGDVAVAPDTSSASWNNSGQVVVAGRGTGVLSIHDNGRFDAAELIVGQADGSIGAVNAQSNGTSGDPSLIAASTAVGLRGFGEVIVRDDAIFTPTLVFGVESSGRGFGRVESSGGGAAPALWETQTFIIGGEGFGSLNVGSGGTFSAYGTDDNLIANAAGSGGQAIVDGCDALLAADTLTVSQAGEGFVEVTNGGRLEVSTLSIGFGQGGEGDVSVSGACPGETASAIVMPSNGVTFVGGQGTGVLRLSDGASAHMGEVRLGVLNSGVGLAVVDNADWVIGGLLGVGDALDVAAEETPTGLVILRNGGFVSCGSLVVLPGCGIFGSGTLQVPAGPGNSVEGTLAAGVWVQTPPPVKQGGLAQRLRGHGTLVIDGDIEMTGSVLDLSIGGTGPNHHDTLVVNGDLNLDGVTIQLHFTGAYGPQAGDLARLVEVSGAFDATDLTLEYAGLEDGFDYAMDEDGGALVFEALTDCIGISPPPTDLNLDGAVNAIDVQLVINGALGLIGVAETDVDFDGNTNAVDVQLVINAALGL